MALQYRTIRAAASALLIAVAMGAGGTTAMTSALAADPPAGAAFGIAGVRSSTPEGGLLGTRGTPDRGLTPPPTDVLDSPASAPDRLGPALTLGFVIGLIVSALLLTPRPGSRRRG